MRKKLLLLLIIAFGADTFGQSCSPDSLIHRTIEANDTDSNINAEFQEHQVYFNPDCTLNNKLLLHLVGSIDNPANTTYFPILAANNGFKVITLKYPNLVTALGNCGNSSDIDCFWNFRNEIIFGEDTSDNVNVDSDNCIINRLEKLLIYLHAEYPTENWDNFLSDTDYFNWPQMVLSGHSQGGGHAAFLAKQYDVDRVLLFASPNDYSNNFSAPAPWISYSSLTPDSSYYAFGNLFDDIVDFEKQYQIWEDLNILDPVDSVNVYNSSCPYENSRVLYTTDTSSTSLAGPHSAMIIDIFTPLISDVPVFTPVWKYMLGICDVVQSVSDHSDFTLEINAYPNPTSGKIIIESQVVIRKVEIYNSLGELVEVVNGNGNNIELDLEKYGALLFLKLTTIDSENVVINVLVQSQ